MSWFMEVYDRSQLPSHSQFVNVHCAIVRNYSFCIPAWHRWYFHTFVWVEKFYLRSLVVVKQRGKMCLPTEIKFTCSNAFKTLLNFATAIILLNGNPPNLPNQLVIVSRNNSLLSFIVQNNHLPAGSFLIWRSSTKSSRQ